MRYRHHVVDVKPLFRSMTATRFIVEVAVNGPVFIKNLPTVLGIDKHHVFDLVCRFKALGVVVVNPVRRKPFTVELNKHHFLFVDLRRLLFRMARRKMPKLRCRTNSGSEGTSNCLRLFGTRGRTLSLAWIAHLGEVNETDLRRLVQVRDQSVRVLVLFWERIGVISSRRLGGERVLSLNRRHRLTRHITPLLEKLHRTLPGAVGLAEWERAVVERRKGIDRIQLPSREHDVIPFGTPTQRRLLALLGTYDALPVSAIARALNWTQDRVRGVGHSLRVNGLIATARVPGDRNGSLWFALAPKPAVESYLRPLVTGFTVPKAPPHQLPLRRPRFRSEAQVQIPGPALVRKVLSALLICGDLEDIEIARVVSSSPRVVRRILARLAAADVIQWRAVGGRAKAGLNKQYPLYSALVRFLKAARVDVDLKGQLDKIGRLSYLIRRAA